MSKAIFIMISKNNLKNQEEYIEIILKEYAIFMNI